MRTDADFHFRPARATDLPACADLFLDVFNGPPWNEHWERADAVRRLADCFGTPGFQGWVGEAAGKGGGSDDDGSDDDGSGGGGSLTALALGDREPYNGQSHYFLKEMCVAPAWQRRGVGRALVDRLTADLAAAGVHRVYLLTARDGVAEAFYRSCGFYVSPRMIMMSRRLSE